MKEFKSRIMDHIWRIVAADDLRSKYGVDGDCDPVHARHKSIRFDPILKPWDKLETVLHECFHAGFPSVKEDDVERFNRHVRKILEKLFELSDKEEPCELESSVTSTCHSNTPDTSNSACTPSRNGGSTGFTS